MIYYIGLLTIILELLILALYIRMINRVQQQNIVLENNIHQAELYYIQLKDRSDSIRKFRHDLQKHIRIVEQFLSHNQDWEDFDEYHQLQGYMEKMKEELAAVDHNSDHEDELISAICQIIKEMCNEKGISFHASVSATHEDLKGIDSYHLTGIVMNLLDNAYEACSRITDSPSPSISLDVSREKEGVSFSVGNSVQDDFNMDFRTNKPDREFHGIGLGIARDYAAIYGGSLEFDYDRNKHYLTVKTLLKTSS